MQPVILYHNPDCSKSQAALALLEENDIEPEIVYYLEQPPSIEQLKDLLKKLDLRLHDILRRNEPDYDELGLDDTTLNEEIVFDLVSKHPHLLQRPIIVQGDRAIIGRPPESVLPFVEQD